MNKEQDTLESLESGKQWAGLKAVVTVRGPRTTHRGETTQSRYYLSSLQSSSARMLEASLGH